MVALHVNVAATWFMVGLIWIVQVVHYPLFAAVGEQRFVDYEAGHTARITAVLAVPWALEAATSLWLVAAPPGDAPRLLALAGLGLVAATAAVTAVVHVPLHRRLGDGFDPGTHRRLVRTNWLRTALWSLHGLVVVGLLGAA